MNITQSDHKILMRCFGRILLLAVAFFLGSVAGKIEHSARSAPVSGSILSASENWGLSFPEEGKLPTANASIEDLKQYAAYYAQDTEEKILYLTFDCGYENGATPAILDALKKHQVPAAFFVVGNFVRDNPDLIQRMTKEGHTVGNHTFSHPDMSKISSLESFQKELSAVEALYQKITGTDMIKYYRPPQGIYSTENLKMAQSLGYHTFSGVLPTLTGSRMRSLLMKKLSTNSCPAYIPELSYCCIILPEQTERSWMHCFPNGKKWDILLVLCRILSKSLYKN